MALSSKWNLFTYGCVLTFTIVMLFLCAPAFAELPKIACRSGETYGSFYYADTGKPFYPEGNVFQRVDASWVQCQFNENVYDSEEAETALAWMEEQGYTVVRVWIDCTSRASNYSIAGPSGRNQIELYPAYMANLFDFLRRATNHHIYVMISSIFFPINTYYVSIAQKGQLPDVTGWNSYFYSPGTRQAVATYWGQFAQEIASADSGELTNTVLSFEIWNEICSMTDAKPFSLSSGIIQTADGAFDMGSAESRQSCHDIGLSQFIIDSARQIRQIIPDALCTCSVFTNQAVGHSSFNGLLPINTADHRWPARISDFPSIPDISYIDIHFYPDNNSWSAGSALATMEWSSIDKTQKPFYVTEFGANKGWWTTATKAANMLKNVRTDLYNNYGIQGECLYTFDSEGDSNYWACTESDAKVSSVLAPSARWKLYEFNAASLENWTAANMSDVSVADGHISATLTQNPASLTSPASLNIDTKYVRSIVISLMNDSSANGLDLYWITTADTTWDETKSIHLALTPYASNYEKYVFDLWDNPEWNGIVTQLRIVPGRLWGGGSLSGTTYINYIRVTDGLFTPDASDTEALPLNWLPLALALLMAVAQNAQKTWR